jgi:hypothetical protein
MATIVDFASWVDRDLSRFGNTRDNVEVVATGETELRIRIYTDVHRYTISASDPKLRKVPLVPFGADSPAAVDWSKVPHQELMNEGYLGCTASCRKPRAGEDWTRGSDLADGPLTEAIWRRILADIVSYEMVRVHRQRQPTADELARQQQGQGPVAGNVATA